MQRALSIRKKGLFLIGLAAVVSVLIPGAVSADHGGPALFFTDAVDSPLNYVVLVDVGDSALIRVAAHAIGTDNADTVQLKIVHDATVVTVTSVQCIGMYSPALASWSGVIVGVGTGAICSTQHGPLTDEGPIIEFTVTRITSGDASLSLSESDPLGTTFVEAGAKFRDLEPPVVVDTSATVAVLAVTPTATPVPTSTPIATVEATSTIVSPPPPPPATSTPEVEASSEPVAPGTPQNVTAVSGAGTVTVSWDPPVSDGGSPITKFFVTVIPGGRLIEVPGDENSIDVDGLEPGITYRFHVNAQNLAGTSFASSTTNPVTLVLVATPTPMPAEVATATPEPTEVPTATPGLTATPMATVIPTATPTAVVEITETTSVIDTTITASADEWDELQTSFEELFGDGVVTNDAPIAMESTDGLLTVELVAEGIAPSDAIEGALVIQLGNLALDTVDGVGTGSISLGAGLAVEGIVQLTTQDDAIVAVLTSNVLVYAPAPPPPSTIGDLTQINVGFRVDVSRVPDGASLTVTYASTAEELVEVTGAVFELAASNGSTLNPDTDIAFAVNVAKTGITNDELGTNEATLTVDLAWYEARIAEGKSIVITKIGDDGVIHTVEAACELQGIAVLCTAIFDGEAGGFSWFVLVALVEFGGTGGSDGPGAGPMSPEPTAIAPTPAPAPAPTPTVAVEPTEAPSDSAPTEIPEGSSSEAATVAPAPTAVSPSATPEILPTSAPALQSEIDISLLPGLDDRDGGGGLAWWIWTLIAIVAAPAIIRAVMTIVAMRRRIATAQGT